MVELRALGSIDLRRQGTEVAAVLTQPKRLALLLYLDVARPHGFHRRDRLLAMLWPELDDSHARNALSKAIHHIRRELGENSIATRGDEVMLDPSFIRSDVRVLETALAHDDHLRAVQLYQGPLADGFFVDDAPEFERWLGDERNRIRDGVAEAAWALADKSKEAGKISDATMYARSAAQLMREDEPSIRRLMRFLESVGDRAGALRAYDDFETWLGVELNADPSPDTRAVRDSIRNGDTKHLSDESPPVLGEPVATAAPPIQRTPSSDKFRYAAYAGAAILVAVIAVMASRSSSTDLDAPAMPVDKHVAAVARFENRTGDPTLDSIGVIAMDWISQDVAASGIVSVVDPRTRSTANAGLVVSGAYYKEGARLRFQAQLASAGTISRVFSPVTATLTDPIHGIEQVASQATASIAEASDARVAALARGSLHAPTYAAYREYVQGIEAFTVHDERGSYDHFMHAYQLDTTFATALLNANASLLNRFGGNDSILSLLMARRESLTPFNKQWLDLYLAIKKNDLEAIFRLSGDLARQAPGSYFPFIHASAAIAINRPRAARDEVLRIDPASGWMHNYYDYWYVRCAAQHMLGDFNAELADSHTAEKQYPANLVVISCRVRALATLGRGAELDSVFDAAAATPQHGTWELGSPYAIAASEASAHGYPEIAARARKRAVDWVNTLPSEKKSAEPFFFGPAWMLFYAGAWQELRDRVQAFRKKNPNDQFWIPYDGMVAAHFGDRATATFADSVLQIISKPGGDAKFGRMPLSVAEFHRAEIAALSGDSDTAIKLLGEALAGNVRMNIYMHSDPAFESIRRDPRFLRMMAPRD